MSDLTDKIAVITGGTSGIGAASAIKFPQAGAVVIIAGRDVTRGNDVLRRIQESTTCGDSCFMELDVSRTESINDFVSRIKKHFGRLDILFNNAGVFPVASALENIRKEDGEFVFDINFHSLVMMTQACMPLLIESGGTVLNNASIAGLQSYTAGQSYMYAASKAAVIKTTQLWAKKYGAKVRVNAICPGVTRTPIWNNFDENKYIPNIPQGRVGTPEDVASVAAFLVSDEAGFVNGAVLPVDGGQSL